jgi:hypothetical protein
MPLKRADHHHEPMKTFWKDGREGVLFTMEDATVERVDPIRCFVTRGVLDGLRGNEKGSILEIFHARRPYFEKAAERAYDTMGQPKEIVLDETSFPELRSGLVA